MTDGQTLKIAMVLDPRFKLRLLDPANEITRLKAKVVSEMQRLSPENTPPQRNNNEGINLCKIIIKN